jgi:hypothetical protein
MSTLMPLLEWAAVIGLVVAATVGHKRWRRRADAEISEQWDDIHRQKATTPGADLAEIATVYQRARRGTKAIIEWIESGERQDTWFAHHWPAPGAIVLIRGSTGWGPHNHNPNTYYVAPGDVLRELPARSRKAVQRHHRRQHRIERRGMPRTTS